MDDDVRLELLVDKIMTLVRVGDDAANASLRSLLASLLAGESVDAVLREHAATIRPQLQATVRLAAENLALVERVAGDPPRRRSSRAKR